MHRIRPLIPAGAFVVLVFAGCATDSAVRTRDAPIELSGGYSFSKDADGHGYFVRGPEIPVTSVGGARLFSAWNGTSAVYGVFIRTWRQAGSYEPWSGCVTETGRRLSVTAVGRVDGAGSLGTTQVVKISLDKETLDAMSRGSLAFTLVAKQPLSFRIPAARVREFLKYVDETRSRSSMTAVRSSTNRDL